MAKKLSVALLAFLLILLPVSGMVSSAQATELVSLTINLDIDEDGNGHFEQVWETNDNRGTEKYIVIDNLKPTMKLTEFEVYEFDKKFEELPDWDVNASLDEKAFKSGINYNGTAQELCWGIGSYGKHKFTVKYTISNVIEKLDDAQVLNWQFVNPDLSEPPQNLKINITSKKFAAGIVQEVNTFGFKGDFKVTPTNISVQSTGDFGPKNYVVVLAKIAPDTYNTETQVFKTYQQVRATSFEGVQKEKWKKILWIALFVGLGTVSVVAVVLAIAMPLSRRRVRNKYLKSASGYGGSSYSKPPEFNIPKMYQLLELGNKSMSKEFRANLLSAYIMRWILDKRVTPVDDGSTIFGKQKYAIRIIDKNDDPFLDDAERMIFSMLIHAAGDNNVVEAGELKSYFQTTSGNLSWQSFTNHIENRGKHLLADNGWSEEARGRSLLVPFKELRLTSAGVEELSKVMGFRYYLETFTIVDEREMQEVVLWKYYLIYATLFGCADRVYEQLKRLVPNIKSVLAESENITSIATNLGDSGYSGITSGSFDGGGGSGGGGSFSGGGGGSSGGGSGGGTR
ncbi:hypothetical protein BK816_08095 [Boudabousia tangfeifanii]|uniref:DUF2207 domain-containing protein n=1 Tax=Boudabousia tangfeifanii TaxID=1912795 RepID=A0A1D9MM33_9ACTO|nr:DUF2207 domain-containing protein [Boudabousia tangfeifanii]AOZ73249.1 hypothetical protein BK816_08095 [Boudabousia tangfeifanii]